MFKLAEAFDQFMKQLVSGKEFHMLGRPENRGSENRMCPDFQWSTWTFKIWTIQKLDFYSLDSFIFSNLCLYVIKMAQACRIWRSFGFYHSKSGL